MDSDWLWHRHNIEAKMRESRGSSYYEHREKFKDLLNNQYAKFHKEQMSITGTEQKDIEKKVELLDKYYGEIDRFIREYPGANKSSLRGQAKLRPTILEEFCGYLFKDLPEIKRHGLSFYNKRIFAGLGINEKGETRTKTKDVDFCIGKEIEADFGQSKRNFIIPIVAVECKTYTDKTMFSEAQFTAQSLKNGTPDVRVYVISETNQIATDEIPSQTPMDQYYVLKAKESDPIAPSVMVEFFNEVRQIVKNIMQLNLKSPPGKMITR